MPTWLILGAAVVVGGLGLLLVGWYARDRVRERKKAKYFAELSAQYRRKPDASGRTPDADVAPAKPVDTGQMVTVEELVARIAAEGLPVRLRWEGGHRGDDDGEAGWPTG